MDDETDLEQNITGVERQGRRVPRASEVHHFQTALKEGLEAQSIGTLLLIEQYTSLRNEIEKRIEIRQQILALTLLVAGAFLTVGVQSNVPEVVLLFYPIIIAAVRYLFELVQQSSVTNVMESGQAGLAIAVVLLFLIDVGVVLYTYYLVQHKRL